MQYSEFSYRHGKELIQILHPAIIEEIQGIFNYLERFPHGLEKNKTCKDYITTSFVERGWKKENIAEFATTKSDYIDLFKDKIAIEMEFSRFEMFFRDFFRFMLLYEKRIVDATIIITFDKNAYSNWGNGVNPYKSARASLDRLVDFLTGDYSSIITVPIWCIGIE